MVRMLKVRGSNSTSFGGGGGNSGFFFSFEERGEAAGSGGGISLSKHFFKVINNVTRSCHDNSLQQNLISSIIASRVMNLYSFVSKSKVNANLIENGRFVMMGITSVASSESDIDSHVTNLNDFSYGFTLIRLSDKSTIYYYYYYCHSLFIINKISDSIL